MPISYEEKFPASVPASSSVVLKTEPGLKSVSAAVESPLPDSLPSSIPSEPIDQSLRQAIEFHHAGNLAEAERLYRAILASQPRHADANHNLGVLAVATGHAGAGLKHFQTALEANPQQGQYWLSCIDALLHAGQPEAARRMLAHGVRNGLRGTPVRSLEQRISEAMPAKSPYRAKGRRRETRTAVASPVIARSTSPPSSETARLTTLFAQGRFAEAEPLARSLTRRFPAHGFGWKALGVMLQQQGRTHEALEAKEHAASLLPTDAEAQSNLGNALLKLCRFSEAEALYRRALALRPDYPEAWNNLGITLQKLGSLTEAEAHCRRALELRPVYADASSNLGIVLQEQSRLREAEATYRAALAIDPGHADAANNLGITLQKQGRLVEAEAAHRRAIELKPESADAFTNLAGCLQQQARLADAEACYRRAIRLDPEQMNSYTNLLFCLSHKRETSPETLFLEHRGFAERFEAPLRARRLSPSNSRDPDRTLRIGFVSADLRDHAMSYFIEPLLTSLAGIPELELYVYANHVLEDDLTARLRKHIFRWDQVFGLSDDVFAERIRADAIDILVDLSGHTGGHRLLVFARKPAPLQCGWIGYLGTSGMESIDYYLADRYFLPPGEFDQYFTETVVHLPAVACFQPKHDAPPVRPLPALVNGHITFGSFSRMGKLSREVVALWSRLLRAVPDSHMLLGAMPRDGHYEVLARWFAEQGIATERLHFHLGAGMLDYLELHHQVDICLDPFPFTGATTTCHAMWMGVPTLTLEGRTASGRLGTALLRHAGLGEFVARDEDDFLARGLASTQDLNLLAGLRAGLRQRFLESPIGQPATVARGFTNAFRQMWKGWCKRQP